ncbi:hypothetical protein CgunFtcFv8_002451 [Champsocephalus gunnari]|uniref:Uncharacterized protein n=1 Tax=Champsocephalus gunnari TaxID=52237 RepID=A0AAN8HMQ2_CHAGU|nr:hypothetical protein CgunFtcFv8_002451 [Champsocephalus gunnari]
MLRRKRSVSFGGFGWVDKSTVSALRARKQELLNAPHVAMGDSPPSPPRTAPPTMKTAHFFDLMEDDYIPYPRIEEVLERGGAFPQVILPEFGGYWIEDLETREGEEEGGGGGGRNSPSASWEHLNFCSAGGAGSLLLLSVRHEEQQQQQSLHVIIRSRTKSVYHRLSLSELPEIPSVPELAKKVYINILSISLSLLSEQRSFDSCHSQEVRELPSNPSSPEAGPRDRVHVKKERISRSTSSSCSFSSAEDTHLAAEGQTPVIVCRSPTELKNRNSPRSNLKFRFDRLSHSAAGN